MKTEEVIKAIKQNKGRVLTQALYKMAYPPIAKFIKQKRGTEIDAEDCFQDALLTLVKKVKLNTFDENYEVKNFLFVVARNSWYNRSSKSSKLKTSEIEDDLIQDENLVGEEVLIADERKNAIQELMTKAGERCKQLLKLVLFEGKSLTETAEIMGFSNAGVAKTNHYRCKQKLKTALKTDPDLLSALKVG